LVSVRVGGKGGFPKGDPRAGCRGQGGVVGGRLAG